LPDYEGIKKFYLDSNSMEELLVVNLKGIGRKR
jgi:hypothetical protein